MDFPRCLDVIHSHNPDEFVILDYHARFLRRKVLETKRGLKFLVDLPKTRSISKNEAFLLEDGRLVGVVFADEELLQIKGDLLRFAWHIGNRHVPCQIEGARLLIQKDHVIKEMLIKLGAEVETVKEPFNPEVPMVTDGRTAMPTEQSILTLSQWISPSYPVGSFTYSHGLEALVNLQWLGNADSLSEWLFNILQHGAARTDALFLAAAYKCNSDEALIEINRKARALASSQERLLEMDELGKAFKSVTEAVWPIEIDELVYPIAIGFCANVEGIELNLTTSLYLQAYVSNLVSAAQRLMPLGQTEAQKIIKTLSPICLQVADETRDGNLDNIYSSVFISDIAAMKHETQVSRIFKT